MSFLSNYLEYSSNNECPETYHLFSGLTVLAALTGRRIWFDQAYWRHYGNLYTVLVGPAGNGKSVASFIAGELMEDIGNVPTSSDCCSPRKLLEEMAETHEIFKHEGKEIDHSPLVALPDEISNFISQDAPLMVDTLTSIWYKKKHKYSTSHQGSFVIHGPSLTLLTCAVPEWITSHLCSDVITGGFSRRVLWIYRGERDKVVLPSQLTVTPRMLELRSQLISHGRAVQKVVGEFKYDNGVSEYFDKWYESWKKKKNFELSGYDESKPGFLIKLAMLLSLSDQMEKVIKRCYLDEALELLAKMEKTFMKVFEGLSRNKLYPISNQIFDIIKKKGEEGLSESSLRVHTASLVNNQEFDEILVGLLRCKKIAKISNRLIASTNKETKTGDIDEQGTNARLCQNGKEA